MPSDLQVDNIKDGSATKTLATLSSSAVTLHSDVTIPASIGGTMCYIDKAVSSGSTAIMEFDNLDNSYAYYKFVLYRCYPATNDKDFYVSLGPTSTSDSSYLTGSSDYLNGASQFTTNSDTYNNISGYLAWAYAVGNSYSNDSGLSGELNLWNCSDTSINTSANWSFIHSNENEFPYGNVGVGNTNGTISAITKIKFHWESATNFVSGSTIVQYGVKHG